MNEPELELPTSHEHAEERRRVIDERFVELYQQQRTYSFLLAALGFCLGLWGLTCLPSAHEMLHVSSHQMAVAMAFQGLSFTVATVCARHLGGVLGRPHLVAERVESVVSALVAALLIYLSGSAVSFFWFLTAAHALHGAVDLRGARFTFGSHLVALALLGAAFLVKGSSFDAAATFFCAGVILFLAHTQERSNRRILDLEVERNLLRKRLENLAIEQERSRIARDLHDAVGAQLAAVAWSADALALDDEKGTADLREISARARAGLRDLRQIVSELKAEEMDLASFAAAIEQRGRLVVPSACSFKVTHQGEFMLSRDSVIQLELMIRESVRNAVQHGKANAIRVDLQQAQSELCVSVRDDGPGLPPGASERSRGGLSHLKKRASNLGADLSLETSTRGTQVNIRLRQGAQVALSAR